MVPVQMTCLCSDATLAVFAEVAELLFHGLRRAGAQVQWAPRSMRRGCINLVLAAHRMPPALLSQLVPERVIVNLEQVCVPSAWRHTVATTYRGLLQSSHVIDYSETNRAWLQRELGVDPEVMLLGHVPELERIPRARDQDIDVLFYGEMTPRRADVLATLERRGLRVLALGGAPSIYGHERDALVARTRVCLNLHQYDVRIFEQVRVHYLLANGKAVVTELHEDTEIPDAYRALVVGAAGVDAIVERCRELVANDHARREREAIAREGMRALPQAPLLAQLKCLEPALS